MKRLPLSLLATLFAALLVACGDDPVPEPQPEPQPVDTVTPTPEPEPGPVASVVGWPAQYGGVMLQGFYWDGFTDAAWTRLTAQADELTAVTVPSSPSRPSCRLLLFTIKIVTRVISGI